MSYVYLYMGFPGGSVVKNLPANEGDVGLIPGSGRSPGEGNGNLLQYPCLGNPMDRGPWQTTVHEVEKESDMTEHRCMHTFKVVTLISSDLGNFQILKRI